MALASGRHHRSLARSTGKGGLGPYYLAQFMREQSRTIVG